LKIRFGRDASPFPASPTQFFKTPSFWEDAVLLLEGVAGNT
jgi:hypothetical protein